jgi:hypothetical protein
LRGQHAGEEKRNGEIKIKLMTNAEFRKAVNTHNESEFLEAVELKVDFTTAKFSKKIKGIVALHRFYSQQIQKWGTKFNTDNKFVKHNLDYFNQQRKKLEELVEERRSYYSTSLIDQLKSSSEYSTVDGYFPHHVPQVDFFLNLAEDYPKSIDGAIDYFKNDQLKFDNRDDMIGAMLAYEFELGDRTLLHKRREGEKKAFDRLRQDLYDTESKLESDVEALVEGFEVQNEANQKAFDEAKQQSNLSFEKWFEKSQAATSELHKTAKERKEELEHTYQELLRLKKPAEYWNERGKTLKTEGWKAIYWLVALVAFACVTLYFLLWLTPEGMLLSFIEGDGSALKWSIVYVTFISFLAFGIRALNKVAFSSFHLARDAEEREQLTYVYLSLLSEKETNIDERDRQLILQALFSRADTGLLKQDSGPTMPSSIVERLVK